MIELIKRVLEGSMKYLNACYLTLLEGFLKGQ